MTTKTDKSLSSAALGMRISKTMERDMSLPEHTMFASSQQVHFIGIGGIGMSGIAEILLTMGYAVSGSDLRASAVTERLEELGAIVYMGHAAENVVASDVIVTSSAVGKDNAEVVEARRRKLILPSESNRKLPGIVDTPYNTLVGEAQPCSSDTFVQV